ncbi:hypothetical protein G9G63_10250 [Paenibacillus sp. EKM202P]|uniref:hypothetical protein n=1 Tax=unclassified Paenibacillus TaxID=185978 RepID=UPI0013EB958F|nr:MULTISPECIES: hypothetical protein [unclassified Paenibacillus]KAF6564515.1 hypothetical protein G9G63_10250 [Paenibacillus sp. EKM202P]KAF6571670.1 hypothetical protein G9G64_06525 [Paenibacillus sp. EKM207P]
MSDKSEVFEDIGEYINRQSSDGYITEDGYPLKCHHCDSAKINIEDTYREDHFVVEKEASCKDCGGHVGRWSYGTWEV